MPFLVAPTAVEAVPVAAAAPASTSDLALWDPTGAYADSVIFKVIQGQDVQVAALVSGDIDHLADNVEASYLDQLQANPYITVTRTERMGFGFMAINCQRYPYSNPHIRRAIAFAADKYEIATIMWQSLGFPLDTPVPASCGVWHNNATTPDFKSPDAASARAELVAGGFVDVDGDGWVEAPNGQDFIFRPMYSTASPQWGAALGSQVPRWTAVGINVQPVALDFNTLLDLVYTIPRNYDGACYAFGLTQPNPTILENWLSTNIANPEGNQLNWANSTYDSLVTTMMTASDYDTVLDAAWAAQEIFVDASPMIIWYSNWEVQANRNDKWTNFVVSPGHGTGPMNRWVPRLVKLKANQPERDTVTGCGGTFKTMISSEIDTQNPLMSTSVYGTYPLAEVYGGGLTGLYDPRTHIATKGGGGLAYDWTVTVLADGLQLDFTLYDNATWHDGVKVTAEDVAFSYNYIRDHNVPTYLTAIGYLDSCVALDDTHVRITSGGPGAKSYWAWDYLCGWDVLPQHIWEGIVSPVTFTNPEPIGFGPLRWYRRVEGEYIELRFWESYHKGVPGHIAGVRQAPSYLFVYVTVGALVIVVVLLGSVWYLRKK